ncbi:MAG TPA: DNA-binding domain-containing protein [Luteibacter sp.]|uniref:DNA-binding domain-containing protein n=1 Tax=Luteibacter sp. TaxID=1886636 RepID=UPI002C39C48F|nr:DNA-binding domain-containing protein [Luteibacter sp.]HVI54500.1 DNA-binding domain-containing protein [Luteibacter sp.]
MSALARFQAGFAHALHGDVATFAAANQAAFAVYRNTALRACLDALEANYPAVACLVGREWFRAAAAIYVSQSPPRDPRLSDYGDTFASFLAAFEPAGELPYLADVARLDRLWSESLVAADAVTLTAATMVTLEPDAIASLRLRVHPATRSFTSSQPAVSIWEASRAGIAVDAGLVWRAESAIVTRVDHGVRIAPLDVAAVHLLATIDAGASLADAAQSTLSHSPDARIDLLLADLLQAGAFAT